MHLVSCDCDEFVATMRYSSCYLLLSCYQQSIISLVGRYLAMLFPLHKMDGGVIAKFMAKLLSSRVLYI